MHRSEIGELLNPSALGFVPSVSLADAHIDAFSAYHGMTRSQSVGPAPKQTSNYDRKIQFAIPKWQQDVGWHGLAMHKALGSATRCFKMFDCELCHLRNAGDCHSITPETSSEL